MKLEEIEELRRLESVVLPTAVGRREFCALRPDVLSRLLAEREALLEALRAARGAFTNTEAPGAWAQVNAALALAES